MIRTYSDLIRISTFEDRFSYLKLDGVIGKETFGFDRWLNQTFYTSSLWRDVIRPKIIVRDLGCDLGINGLDIQGSIIIHHMNPISISDIVDVTDYLLDPEYLICCSSNTHKAIHYGNKNLLKLLPVYPISRRLNDTIPWKE